MYKVKYRLPGRRFYQTVKNVTGDGIVSRLLVDGEVVALATPYRFLETKDGGLIHIPYDAEVIFSSERSVLILKKMSKVAGQQVQSGQDVE